MTWFARQRQAWIAETLRIFGFINRDHLMKKFGISRPQASLDLATFQRRHPGAIRYHPSERRYVVQDPPPTRGHDADSHSPEPNRGEEGEA